MPLLDSLRNSAGILTVASSQKHQVFTGEKSSLDGFFLSYILTESEC